MMTSKKPGEYQSPTTGQDLGGGTAPIVFEDKGLSLQKAVIIADTFNVYSYAVDVYARK